MKTNKRKQKCYRAGKVSSVYRLMLILAILSAIFGLTVTFTSRTASALSSAPQSSSSMIKKDNRAGWDRMINVRFNSNGGSYVPDEEVEMGEHIRMPLKPIRDGYRFVGWFYDSKLTKIWDFIVFTITDKVVCNDTLNLYAKWEKVPTQTVYRLYNPNTGEHFYTVSHQEKDNITKIGWNDEGVAWQAPVNGDFGVYRLYNPNAEGGDHYYTKNIAEARLLASLGWYWENNHKPVFYCGGRAPVYVAYNPNSGKHNYTKSLAEHRNLQALGWQDGNVAWWTIC